MLLLEISNCFLVLVKKVLHKFGVQLLAVRLDLSNYWKLYYCLMG